MKPKTKRWKLCDTRRSKSTYENKPVLLSNGLLAVSQKINNAEMLK